MQGGHDEAELLTHSSRQVPSRRISGIGEAGVGQEAFYSVPSQAGIHPIGRGDETHVLDDRHVAPDARIRRLIPYVLLVGQAVDAS